MTIKVIAPKKTTDNRTKDYNCPYIVDDIGSSRR
jgi:hypothetical protein